MDEQTQTQSTQPLKPTGQQAKRSKPISKILLGIIILLLLIIGWLGWQWWMCIDHDKKTDDEKKQLQSQLEQSKKQLQEALKANSTTAPKTAQCANAATQMLAQNIADAISSKNTAALQGYMANSVRVVIAASEKGGDESPADAVKSLEYTQTGLAPWNFSLPSTEIAGYKAGSYKQYFPDNAYVGRSKDNMVVSFGFDCNGKINMVFMAANAELLS
ncbi:MAG TPA: hypothetical protein VLA88_01085 [Candidatus Saccharimonadales bacterium]|nr:hypothetical protein [Candidatus Saccharimonadales bacterium]